jgi:hypothetical protein
MGDTTPEVSPPATPAKGRPAGSDMDQEEGELSEDDLSVIRSCVVSFVSIMVFTYVFFAKKLLLWTFSSMFTLFSST